MFPGPNAQIYRNEAGEPLGWDYPSDEPYEMDPYEEIEAERRHEAKMFNNLVEQFGQAYCDICDELLGNENGEFVDQDGHHVIAHADCGLNEEGYTLA